MKTRNKELHILWSPEEMNCLYERMREAGIKNTSAFIRKMALSGYIVKLDMKEITEMVSLLRYSSNNLNQIAKKLNSTGSIYSADVVEMQVKQEEIWELMKEILARLSTIK